MREQIIKLSNNAANRIKQIMSKAETSTIGVRIGVKSGGCAGMSYIMEYAKEIKPNEEVIEDKGVKVLIDPKAIIYLIGTEMDYKQEKFSSQFVFRNLMKLKMWLRKSFKFNHIIHFKFYRMRSMLKVVNFLKFQLYVRIYLIISKYSTFS